MVENSGRNGGRQGTNGLCVVTKTSAWKAVKCESIKRRRGGGGLSDHFFGGSSAEIGGWLDECQEVGGYEKCVEGE